MSHPKIAEAAVVGIPHNIRVRRFTPTSA
ncbi:hypothetical protein ACNKHM_09960 [Shigella sonnei]